MNDDENLVKEVSSLMNKEIKIINELVTLTKDSKEPKNQEIKSFAESQLKKLRLILTRTAEEISGKLEDMTLTKPLPQSQIKFPVLIKEEIKKLKKDKDIFSKKDEEKTSKHKTVDVNITNLEKNTIKRLKKKKKIKVKKKNKKANKYVQVANKLFGGYSQKLRKTSFFTSLNRDIIKANLQVVISSYISVMLLTSLISVFVGFIIFLFFMFFSIGTSLPIVTLAEGSLFQRFLGIFWIPLVAPIITFLGMCVYPSIEKGYIQNRINQELPFATIHMSAIAGSMLEPSKMFNIIISTKEYPHLEKEFAKIINQINVYGYDFITALMNVASNTPSTKLAELLNGIATTINSGGELTDFFEKRAQTLLFDYKIEREEYTKTSETFMDIYISLVIAAPMILMLLLIMMNVSGLGISLSNSAITLIMILGVSMINILFLVFLQLKQPSA